MTDSKFAKEDEATEHKKAEFLNMLSKLDITDFDHRAPLSKAITITLAVSGVVMGSFKPPYFPYTVDSEVVSQHLGCHVVNAKVVEEDRSRPLDGLILMDATSDISLVLGETLLCNTWKHTNLGTRRFYKEFREFARTNDLGIPDLPEIDADVYPHLYKGVPVCHLVPLILQAYASELRDQQVYNHQPYRHRHGIQPGPLMARSWEGCLHSIRRRTNADRRQAELFVQSWLDANEDCIGQLRAIITKCPHQNYFA